MKLLPKWKNFKIKIEEFIKEADVLLSRGSTIREVEQNELLLRINSWIFKIHSYLKDSFDDADNELIQSFYYARHYGIYINTENSQSIQKMVEVVEELKAKRKRLEYILHLISVCDAIIQNESVDLKSRMGYSKEEILDLVAEKLYYLRDNFYYPLHTILEGNGININSTSKLTEIATILEKRGHIWVIYSKVIKVQLSFDGRNHIDNKRYIEFIGKETFAKSTINTDSLVNKIKSKVMSKEHVKGVLKNEIQNFQSMYDKMLQKSWADLLKEKLTDLESANVINKVKMKMIYQTMTSE